MLGSVKDSDGTLEHNESDEGRDEGQEENEAVIDDDDL